MLRTEDTMIWSEEPLALDAPSSLDGDASYSDMVHGLFSGSPDEEAESLMPVMPVISSSSPNEKHDSRETNFGDMLSSAMEALRSQVTNTTYKLYAQQGPGSSRAFLSSLSTLYTLPNEDFARLCASIHRASTSCDPDTPPTNDVGSPPADSSKEERTKNPAKGSREAKLEKFIANGREALAQLINQHWERLAGGLKVQELQGDPFSSDKRMRRIYHYHELRRLRLDTELHWLRRALSLIRNLRDFQEYLGENGHRPSDTSNHRLRHAYLVYIYAASFSSSSKMCDIRTALKEDLRYAVRWMIFIDALGLGAVLVCGEVIARLVYKTSGNTNDDLKWLATKIRQFPTIDFRALCGIFNIVMADLLQHYQVKHPLNKFELIAKIQTVADGHTTGRLHYCSDLL
ncbi:hypothetical protein BKA61DRAFT_680966 [Leptodontidium sp. MPI-SDFR-AT-0119]|nr:hypothetical protein BKA61DRAFT_680966 [Leptodontidium sp. MPI-SDFR-AT-0119]